MKKIIRIMSLLILIATVVCYFTGDLDKLSKKLTVSTHEAVTKISNKSAVKDTSGAKSTESRKTLNTTSKTKESTESEAITEEDPDFWKKPSETKPYPKLAATDELQVSTEKQRVYIKRQGQVLYTMLCSTGSGGLQATPKGSFVIEPEKGETFYSPNSGEGANYWVSWKDHGIYLFHSVPIDQNGNYLVDQAEELGKKANSHGCVRLTVADAKWLYENAIPGMKVTIT